MNLTPEQLLFTSALDVRSRFVRLISLLEQAGASATPSERRVIKSLSENIRVKLQAYVQSITEVNEGAQAIMRTRHNSVWAGNARAKLAEAAYNGYGLFRQSHDEAYTYVSRNVSVPNDLLHFLFRSLGLSLVSNTHRESVALYPSRHLMWESASSTGEGTPSVVAAILVPYSETTSPMRWPLLVHELAHHLSPGGLNSDDLRKALLRQPGSGTSVDLDEEIDAKDDSLSELQADSIAEDAIGITYAVAMAREASLIAYGNHFGNGRPTMLERLKFLEHGGLVASAIPDEWNLDGPKAHIGTDVPPVIVPGADEIEVLIELGNKLREGRQRAPRSDKTERARVLLQQGDPIPAVPRLGTPSQNAFEDAAAGIYTADSLKKLFLSVADVPLTDAEILEAAWAEELDTPVDELIERLLATTVGDAFEIEKLDLDASDVRLSRSLQAAAVHQWLMKNDDDINRAVGESDEAADVGDPVLGEPGPMSEIAQPIGSESSPLSDVMLARRLTLPPAHPRRLVVRPLIDPGQVGGTTIDLRLGTEWETLRTSRFRGLDPSDDPAEVTDLLNESVEEFRLTAGESQGLVLHPGELLLALTLEYLALPNDLWGQLEGRSTWARLGLQVHATAGMVDAGFRGFLTLELQNTGRLPIVLYPGLRVGQMAFFPVKNIARPYGAKPGAAYANQAKARSAFTKQHEHLARYKYITEELSKEEERKSALSKDHRE